MEKLNLFTLKLKLDRHKLKYIIPTDNSQIKLGGSTVTTSFLLINIVIPFSLSILLIIGIIIGFIPYIRKITLFLIMLPTVIGFYGLITWINKRNSNKNIKIIDENKIKIISNGVEKIIESKDISHFHKEIISNEKSDLIKGDLYLIDKSNNKFIILSIFDNDMSFIDKDLNYFKEYFNMILNKN